MQLSNIFTFALAACGAVSAAPTAEEPRTVEARAWPDNGISTAWGQCYGSGRWSKRDEAVRAIQDFCSDVTKVHTLTSRINGSKQYNHVYHWDISFILFGERDSDWCEYFGWSDWRGNVLERSGL
ncbi:hypothetical protein B0T24DRAFT_621722 [Lasiosphaeria ovina]|uniref:Uncharacterized protein n=1 Tax=Lasiosphaeria ovina TaxID=92902 RepID=A0AAE0KA04_9PEZI|nr:hypothetical protein B0T24DRAFT_621722 [Lasiosphaeria ovina]